MSDCVRTCTPTSFVQVLSTFRKIYDKNTNYGEHCAQLAPFTNGPDFSFPNALVQSTHKKWNVFFCESTPSQKGMKAAGFILASSSMQRKRQAQPIALKLFWCCQCVCVHKSRPTCFYTAGRRRKGKEKWALMALPKPTIVQKNGAVKRLTFLARGRRFFLPSGRASSPSSDYFFPAPT